eukprot:286717-Prorocentrum_minimum.AAC.2
MSRRRMYSPRVHPCISSWRPSATPCKAFFSSSSHPSPPIAPSPPASSIAASPSPSMSLAAASSASAPTGGGGGLGPNLAGRGGARAGRGGAGWRPTGRATSASPRGASAWRAPRTPPADSSHTCARARSSSRPVSAALSGEKSGSPSTRSQISASWHKIGCSGHSSSSSPSLSRAAPTGACKRAISPEYPPGAWRSSSGPAPAPPPSARPNRLRPLRSSGGTRSLASKAGRADPSRGGRAARRYSSARRKTFPPLAAASTSSGNDSSAHCSSWHPTE